MLAVAEAAGTVAGCAAAAGVSVRTVRRWRAADPTFRRQLDELLDAAPDRLLGEALDIARRPWCSPDDARRARLLLSCASVAARHADRRQRERADTPQPVTEPVTLTAVG